MKKEYSVYELLIEVTDLRDKFAELDFTNCEERQIKNQIERALLEARELCSDLYSSQITRDVKTGEETRKKKEMLRSFKGLFPTDNIRTFEMLFGDSSGFVRSWTVRKVYETKDLDIDKYFLEPIIEFYSNDTHQFVAAYPGESLLERNPGHALALYTDIPTWTIHGGDMKTILSWVKSII